MFQPIVKSRPFIPAKHSSSKVVSKEVLNNLKKQGAGEADKDKSYKVVSDMVDKTTAVAKDILKSEANEQVSGPYSKNNGFKKDSVNVIHNKKAVCKNVLKEGISSSGPPSWREVLGRRKYAQLEKGITFAMKSVGNEQPEDPIKSFSQQLLLFDKQDHQ